MSGGGPAGPFPTRMGWTNPYRNIVAGPADDLGDGKRYRSTWERNLARLFALLLAEGGLLEVEFEPKPHLEYRLGKGTGRLRRYIPDWRLVLADGTVVYVECKGRYNQAAQTKMQSVAKCQPDKVFVLIDPPRYHDIERWFAREVPHWEGAQINGLMDL